MSKIYKHNKTGNMYIVLSYDARDSQTGEEVVIYQALYEDNKIWVRPKSEFFENVTLEGKVVPRFENVGILKKACFIEKKD